MRNSNMILGLALILCFAILPYPVIGTAGEEEADFDESSSGDALAGIFQEFKDKFKIKLYMDFVYEDILEGAETDENDNPLVRNSEGTFSSHHEFLLVHAQPTDKLLIELDLKFEYYYNITYFFTPDISLQVGKMQIPFGGIEDHAMYGGKVYEDPNGIMPNYFTDYGIALHHKVVNSGIFSAAYDLYVNNGFQDIQGRANFDGIGFSHDNNDKKATGLRISSLLGGYVNVSFSGYHDYFDDDGHNRLALWGFDAGTHMGLGNVPVLKDLNIKFGILRGDVEAEDNNNKSGLIFDSAYHTKGYYGELSYRAFKPLKLVLRHGTLDPDDSVEDDGDLETFAVQAIYDLTKHLQLWGMYQWNKEQYVDEFDNDYFMVKLLVKY